MLLTIEKLIYGGDGLARLPEKSSNEAATGTKHGKAVFVPFVLAQEKIEATLTEQKPGFARATAEKKIIEPSPHRVQPQCPYFTRCGGCHYQHADYQHQLEIKQQILRENLQRIAKLELDREIEAHPSPPWNYRNRSRLQVQTQPNFAIGYFKTASHELLPVEECPISSPLINRGIAALWQLGRAGQAASGVHAIELFANADSQMLITLWCLAEARRAEVRNFAEDLKAALPEILGVTAFREAQSGVKKAAVHDRLVTVGEKHLTYQSANLAYRVSAGAFFQTNRHLTVDLVNTVTQGQSGELALDLYAGVGLFSAALASNFRHIVSVESSDLSFPDLEHNLPAHGNAVQDSTESYLNHPRNPQRTKADASLPTDTSGKPKADLIVVDPPRSGLGDRVPRLLISLSAPRITYVSCDPATLARDLIPFLAAGYRVQQAHLFDLFPQTFHIESVLHLTR